jgi:alpha-tubulin suppressor-like RCC1 family protein
MSSQSTSSSSLGGTLLLWLLAALVLACSDAESTTQVLLTVTADPGVAEQLTAVQVATYAVDESETAPALVDTHRYELGAASGATLPFSLGIVKRKASLFLLVVTGYAAERVIIEHKVRVSFIDGASRPLAVRLAQACVGQLCGDMQTCDPSNASACAPVMVAEVAAGPDASTPAGPDAGAEVERSEAGEREAGNLGPSGDAAPSIDADASPARSDAGPVASVDPCSANPCGVGNGCAKAGASDYQCACAATHFQVDTNRCVPKFSALSVGDIHACGLRTDGTVMCWGSNQWGQLGSDAPLKNNKPLLVPGVTDAVAISAGTESTCVIRANRSAACWGLNAWGELGNGTTAPSLAPVAVQGLSDVASLAVASGVACALTRSGALSCWGGNHGNVLLLGQESGLTAKTKISALPGPIPGVPSALEIALGGETACVRIADGGTLCWGNNFSGQLGDGRTLTVNPPTRVSNLSAVELSLDGGVACARRGDGSVVCSGDNTYGMLGNGTTTSSATFAPVVGLSNAAEISVGLLRVCARRADGSVACWGATDFQNAANGLTTIPAVVPGLSDAVQIGTGQMLGCALRRDGNIVCWGDNGQGQLGDGSSVKFNNTPVAVLAY